MTLVAPVETLIDKFWGEVPPGIPTRYPSLNRIIGGFKEKHLTVLAARPSMGKTAMSVDLSVDLALRGHRVAFVSRESSAREIFMRTCLNLGNGDPFTEEVKEKMTGLPLFINEDAVNTTAIERWIYAVEPDIIFIDYLQKVRGPNPNASRTAEVSHVSNWCKEIARDTNTTNVVLSQLSRYVEHRDDKRPQLSDLKESGDIEQDADEVMFIYRPEVYEDFGDGETELIVRKHRDGPLGIANLRFLPERMQFIEMN